MNNGCGESSDLALVVPCSTAVPGLTLVCAGMRFRVRDHLRIHVRLSDLDNPADLIRPEQQRKTL